MTRVLVDTDVLIDHLRGFRTYSRGSHVTHVSTITRAELFAGRAADEPRIERLLNPMVELAVDRAIAERAGRIRRATGLPIADATIAATAIEHGLIVVSRNRRDFDKVAGLEVMSPEAPA